MATDLVQFEELINKAKAAKYPGQLSRLLDAIRDAYEAERGLRMKMEEAIAKEPAEPYDKLIEEAIAARGDLSLLKIALHRLGVAYNSVSQSAIKKEKELLFQISIQSEKRFLAEKKDYEELFLFEVEEMIEDFKESKNPEELSLDRILKGFEYGKKAEYRSWRDKELIDKELCDRKADLVAAKSLIKENFSEDPDIILKAERKEEKAANLPSKVSKSKGWRDRS